jgi:fatty-acid desaturase
MNEMSNLDECSVVSIESAKKCQSFLGKVLEPPTYGFEVNGEFYAPTPREIFREFFTRLNVFRSAQNWLPFAGWAAACGLGAFFIVFCAKYFSWSHFAIGMTYSMVCMGTAGTIYLHRYSTHRAFKFKNNFARFLVRNLVIKVIPEEIYVISHHVHHQFPEKAGDPYNVNGGFLYCFLADVNHQLINRNLNEQEYGQLTKLMNHTGVQMNNFSQYQKYGSLANPFRTVAHYLLNWAFWFAVFFAIGGVSLAIAIFGCAAIWAFGVRTYNYDGHGRGKDQRQDGIDFNRRDFSVNQVWPGYVAGEWHNNHHLYPNGARSGFLPYQFDLAWEFIRFYHAVGGVASYRCYREEFLEKHYRPFLAQQAAKKLETLVAPIIPMPSVDELVSGRLVATHLAPSKPVIVSS